MNGFDGMWGALAEVGRDRHTGGYRRDAWSEPDLALREWFAEEADRRGLSRYEDRNGNQWAWWGDPSAAPGVVTGSHLDSVRDGGAFDGPLGVVSAFAAVDELRARGVTTPPRPIGVVCFSDEEGARFGVPCVGSRLLTGVLDPARAAGLTDDAGDTLAEVLRRAGRDPSGLGRDDETLRRIGVFVELHVEQGRGLVETGAPVGVASAIWPHGRWRLDFAGRADHAGTTALADRDDPMLPYARAVLAAREIAERRGAVATFGRVRVAPGSANAIPSLVRAWLDARAPEEETVRGLVAELSAACPAEVVCESWTPVVEFDAVLRDRVAAVAGGLRGRFTGEPEILPGNVAEPSRAGGDWTEGRRDTPGGAPVLPTGAGHDAGVLAGAGVPSAMLFVRNPTGVSHSPEEFAEREDCHSGVTALTAVLEDLCGLLV
ncbi:allantoate amidohydrolase [Rhizohabitans arisaemae]|uniref:allantoate amidohydrolase n=1 Tax=Rhizohabitans arisaemae TaxID=2720610 RepID=UPI0024B24D5C|nr:allantoate amidohydrolase [Rhizohabitans arisaemae]